MKRYSVPFAAVLSLFLLLLPAFGQCYSAKKKYEIWLPVQSGHRPSEWGYNYPNGRFSGVLANVYFANLGLPVYAAEEAAFFGWTPGVIGEWWWAEAYRNLSVTMIWNEAFLSDLSCDGDRYLDRHFGFADYRGSGAEVKIRIGDVAWSNYYHVMAVPLDAVLVGDSWFSLSGEVIGRQVWPEIGDFAVIQERKEGDVELPGIPAPQYF